MEQGRYLFSATKIYFAYGFGNSFTFPFSIGATTLLMVGQPLAEAVLDTVETFKTNRNFWVADPLHCSSSRKFSQDKGSLVAAAIVSAAEILSEDVYNAWKHLTGHGSTELSHIYLSNQLDDHRIGAAGARVPGYEIRLVTPDGEPVEPGEEGAMLIRGHSSAPCYWNRAEKTSETMRGDWMATGDRFVERDGYYYFLGRTDDLIKVSGQWVWPMEVERCLNEHPDVHECAILAHELEDRRITLRAVVKLRDGAEHGDVQTRILCATT
ncbi:AMP-binding protein [Rhizobium brockwellii]|uniref:AMP-binding protein n=1 Tax=Rhizobium brockwellii TaxID=3019932 RepID=UPI00293DE453|nr:AMP-binding protein [Rhizobium brockwellii]MDV4183767.1 AMP-binding protein [Rhizobium brockwellii]